MPGFNVSRDVTKVIAFINRNCANCQRGSLVDNIPTCSHDGTLRSKEHIRLTDRCTVNARNAIPSMHCHALLRIEEYDPFL